jgi:hypothetical protein
MCLDYQNYILTIRSLTDVSGIFCTSVLLRQDVWDSVSKHFNSDLATVFKNHSYCCPNCLSKLAGDLQFNLIIDIN